MSKPSKNYNAIDQSLVLRIKAEVKAAIDGIAIEERSRFIAEQISQLDDKTEPEDLIRHFVLLIHLIINSVQQQSLKASEIRQVTKKAYSLLMLAGIKPVNSLVSNLYGELHLALAQASRHAGNHIDAFWQQQLAVVQSRRAPVGDEVFQNINLGIRAERLGQFQLSQTYFKAALSLAQSPADVAKIRVHLLRQARVAGFWSDFDVLANQLESDPKTAQSFLDELTWERALRAYFSSDSPSAILSCLERDKPHYQLSYIAEAKLLSFASKSANLVRELPKITTYQRNLGIKKALRDPRIELIARLEEAYDSEAPFTIRLRDLGESFQRLSELPMIDLEQLAWSAVARWLARNNNFEMANFCIAEYHAIGWRVTAGTSPDPNGLISDLLTKTWYQKSA